MILAALLLHAAAPVDPCAWSAPGPPRRMVGVCVNQFEDQHFYEVLAVGEITRRTAFAALDRDGAQQPVTMLPWLRGHVFEIDLLGVERLAPVAIRSNSGPCPPTGSERSHVRAIRIVSQRDLGLIADVLPTPHR